MTLLTVKDLCKLLNCQRSFVYRLVHERRIPFMKLGHRQLRFSPEAITRWLADNSFKPTNGSGDHSIDVFK